ncbi:septal ring lytic transglycosylase RlpA family protein [Anaplasma marginale]|uniref:Endolytic peptidoglycan transglycosylase RlpA n=2 Tax=Anaplasma marginale TaxID=770 RepID=B9KII8_ANAMF|nr:rare lipoprotein A precursor [Anaplasma marginale str. St. Maries]ACM49300.1 rare lipoprotein A precursor (rlpA) [Anaplasma marginale str. Florida]AXW84038.1 septal ring lytic transglycosylase RlpA family lipoprotein [Anaplasma marginale]KAA8473347.1 septal ring lytic transglycosylase RlpA family protein [Anaplasma marginale]KAB0450918.1 septal ring lytic transglycosylase RlpA family protein [Anaplasma marginale]
MAVLLVPYPIFLSLVCLALGLLQGCTTSATKSGHNGAHYKIGTSYSINGVAYKPQYYDHYEEIGIASWYGEGFHNKLTANGDVFSRFSLTAAHKTLPMPSFVEITNLENGKKVIVKVNDRGPFVENRIIDLSEKAAILLGFRDKGTAKVKVLYLGKMSRNILYEQLSNKARYAKLEERHRKDLITAKTSVGYILKVTEAAHAKRVASELRRQGIQGVRVLFKAGKYQVHLH